MNITKFATFARIKVHKKLVLHKIGNKYIAQLQCEEVWEANLAEVEEAVDGAHTGKTTHYSTILTALQVQPLQPTALQPKTEREIPQGVTSQDSYMIVVVVMESSRGHSCLQKSMRGGVGGSITAPGTMPLPPEYLLQVVRKVSISIMQSHKPVPMGISDHTIAASILSIMLYCVYRPF